MPLSCGMNFRRSKQSKPKRSANTSLYVAHHSSFATSCHNGGETKEFAFAKLEKFLITAKEKVKKNVDNGFGLWVRLPVVHGCGL